ncbi:unnamed protein product [Arabidopsis arenosa]|uniref:Uncharacterized protein n=1 Tax=Arabidopsis arenosa TaxID=38785 RepID=A0A8S2AK93_ARAAE|nr:unnamed protein product [Arabidopsis arenosa]
MLSLSHLADELGKFRDLVVESKDKGVEIVAAVAKQMLDKHMFIFGAVEETSATMKLNQLTELQNARVRFAYDRLISDTTIEQFIHLDMGKEVNLNSLDKISIEYAEAKKRAIEGRFCVNRTLYQNVYFSGSHDEFLIRVARFQLRLGRTVNKNTGVQEIPKTFFIGYALPGVFKMSQSTFMGKNMGERRAGLMVPKRRIKISHFDNSALILKDIDWTAYEPSEFDFETEEDIVEVLKMEPLHFDHWMSFKGEVTQVTRQETRHEAKVSGGYKGKIVADAHNDDRKRSQPGNHNASTDVAAVGVEVESLSSKEVNPEEGEITTSKLQENDTEKASNLRNANREAGLSDYTLNKTNEVEETADDSRDASEMVEEASSDMMVSKVDVGSADLGRDGDMETSRNLKGSVLLMGIASSHC